MANDLTQAFKIAADVHDESSTHIHATLYAPVLEEFCLEASREDEGRNWYIEVTNGSGYHTYDGYWRDSESKSCAEVLAEAATGSLLHELKSPPEGSRPLTPPAATPAAPGEVTEQAASREKRGYLGSTVDGGIDDHDEDRPHQDDSGASQDEGADASAVGATSGLGANQHHQHRVGQADDQRTGAGEIRETAVVAHPAPVAAPAPASEAVAWNIPDQCPHMIVFDDTDVSPLTFAGSSARPAALEAFKRASLQWNAHLFVRVAHNSRDDAYPDATPSTGDSADAPVQQAGVTRWQKAADCWKAFADEALAYIRYLESGEYISGVTASYHNRIHEVNGWCVEEHFKAALADTPTGAAALKGEQPVEPSGTERGEV